MGYTTDFRGSVKLNPPLNEAQVAYLTAFANTRRMERDPDLLPPDPLREAVGLPPGEEGEHFVGGEGFKGQSADESVINSNYGGSQPSLWAQWVPNGATGWDSDGTAGTALVWDGGEKFYSYVEWMVFYIEHFLKPWGIVANGTIEWRGEDWGDSGAIVVVDNEVRRGLAGDYA